MPETDPPRGEADQRGRDQFSNLAWHVTREKHTPSGQQLPGDFDRQELIQKTHLSAESLLSHRRNLGSTSLSLYVQIIFGISIAALAFLVCLVFSFATTGPMQVAYLIMGGVVLIACSSIAAIQLHNINLLRWNSARILRNLEQIRNMVAMEDDAKLWSHHVFLTFQLETIVNRKLVTFDSDLDQSPPSASSHDGK